MKNPRLAVIGAGLMGKWHAHAATAAGGKLIAIIDFNLKAARSLAYRYPSVKVFKTLTDCLATHTVDVVHICTPLDSHGSLIEQALRAKCHVLAEKPLVDSVEKTQELIQIAEIYGLNLIPVHQFPFQAGFQNILKQRHRLGSIVRVTYQTCTAGGIGKSVTECKSILLEILPHPVSLLYALFGNDFNPYTLEILQADNDDLELVGRIGTTQLSLILSLRGRPTCNQMQIIGTSATAHIDLYHGYSVLEAGPASRTFKIRKPFCFSTHLLWEASFNLAKRAINFEPAYPGLQRLVRAFYKSLNEPKLAPIKIDEIIVAAQLYENVKRHLVGQI